MVDEKTKNRIIPLIKENGHIYIVNYYIKHSTPTKISVQISLLKPLIETPGSQKRDTKRKFSHSHLRLSSLLIITKQD